MNIQEMLKDIKQLDERVRELMKLIENEEDLRKWQIEYEKLMERIRGEYMRLIENLDVKLQLIREINTRPSSKIYNKHRIYYKS